MNKDRYTIRELHLEVDSSHTLYIQDWGNPNAKVPIISLHGGPGGQSKDSHKGSYDPAKQRVIFFDQRGSGQSLPYGSLKNNTTQDLIRDINSVADKLDVSKFILVGRSWGSCLALAYALEHSKRVKAMVLSGVFTGSQSEIDWLDKGHFELFYPDAWQAYLEATPKEHRDAPSNYHFDKVFNGTEEEQKKSAFAYETLEGAVIGLDDRPRQQSYEEYDSSGVRIEIHYLKNRCFMQDNYILENAHKLTMPITLVQGRYDMVCPPITAFRLHNSLKNSELYTTLSGHIAEHEDVQLITQALRHYAS